jgi:hemerythrin
MSLVWREQLSVGNDVIDSDHRHLIDIINRVEQSLSAKSRRDLAVVLESLSRYASEHFAREEKIADAAGYAQVPHLSEAHKGLIAELERTKAEFSQMTQDWSPDVADRFVKLLRNWLVDHVVKEDLLMKPVLQKHSPLFDPR